MTGPTRRRVAAGLGVGAAAATLAAALPDAPAARRHTPRTLGFGVRKDAHRLSSGSDDVVMYCEAVERMRAIARDDPFHPLSWSEHWAQHSIFCATGNFARQVHYGWNLLPWHRAYLVSLEQKIRFMLNEPGFALPYWDWTRNPTVPEWFFGEDNPLDNPTRYQGPGDRLPADFTDVGLSLRARRWAHFGGRERAPGQLQIEGTLEQSCHNNVHNWVGGDMASFDGAGNDPLFQAHHGQVDRLWEAWRAQPGRAVPEQAAWREGVFWFRDWEGRPSYLSVGDLLDPEALGYRYEDLSFAEADLSAPPTLDEGEGTDYGALILGEAMRARIDVAGRGAGRARVTLNYLRASLPAQPFQHRLFFVIDGAPRFVGTYTILPIPDLFRGLEDRVVTQTEVPPDVASSLVRARDIRVVGQPVRLQGRRTGPAPLPFSGVALTVEA